MILITSSQMRIWKYKGWSEIFRQHFVDKLNTLGPGSCAGGGGGGESGKVEKERKTTNTEEKVKIEYWNRSS
jgi:hypothetical protein